MLYEFIISFCLPILICTLLLNIYLYHTYGQFAMVVRRLLASSLGIHNRSNRNDTNLALSPQVLNSIVSQDDDEKDDGELYKTPPSFGDRLRIFFLVSRVLNRDLALQVMEMADFDTQNCTKTFTTPETVMDNEQGRVVLRSEPIRISPKGARHCVKRIGVEVKGHDQGWAGGPGSWTWYNVAVVTPRRKPQPECTEDQKPRGEPSKSTTTTKTGGDVQFDTKAVLEFARNARADRRQQVHSTAFEWDDDGGAEHADFLAAIQDGDSVELRACALYPMWTNNVHEARILIDVALF